MWSKNHKKCKKCETKKVPHKALGFCKRCYETHQGYKWQKAYNRKNVKMLSQKKKEWLKANPEKAKLHPQGKVWFVKISKRDGEKCRNCGINENLTLQHKIPRCIGGKYSYENLEILCQKCNIKDWNILVKKSLKFYFKES